jgi:hypothetical protein
MRRLLISSAIGLGVLFGALAPTFVPTPASAYYYHHRYYHHRYYRHRYYGHRPYYRHYATTIITVIGVGGISQEGPMRHDYALILIAVISALLTAAAPAAPSLEGDWKRSGIVSSNLGADRADCKCSTGARAKGVSVTTPPAPRRAAHTTLRAA